MLDSTKFILGLYLLGMIPTLITIAVNFGPEDISANEVTGVVIFWPLVPIAVTILIAYRSVKGMVSLTRRFLKWI